MSETANIEQPKHQLHALTTYELARYKRELQHAVKTLPEHAPVRELLQQKLAQVLAEQQSRIQLQQASGTNTHSL
jgi:hypothetical protein